MELAIKSRLIATGEEQSGSRVVLNILQLVTETKVKCSFEFKMFFVREVVLEWRSIVALNGSRLDSLVFVSA